MSERAPGGGAPSPPRWLRGRYRKRAEPEAIGRRSELTISYRRDGYVKVAIRWRQSKSVGRVGGMTASDFERAAAEFHAGNYGTARAMLIPLAEAGVADAQCLMGNIFHLGRGTENDATAAAAWYDRAARQGSALACNNLWTLYRTLLRSSDPDGQRARPWYDEARRPGFAHLPSDFY